MTICRSCNGTCTEVLNLGDHRLSDFVEPVQMGGITAFPLRMVICNDCSLLQLADTTPRNLLYHDRYGFRSGTNEAIRADLADVVQYALAESTGTVGNWLDIACNDGTLLSFVPKDVQTWCIDPVMAIVRDAVKHADVTIGDYFRPSYFDHERFNVITSVSMFYDLDDPNEFVAGVAGVLASDGIWVIQQNYAADMLARNAVDNICHEHVTYFSVESLLPLLERHGLEINDVTYSDVNGGCFRVLVTHHGNRAINSSVGEALANEGKRKLARPETWQAWGRAVVDELSLTRKALLRAKERGERVFLYGASTRGGTFLQMIDAGPDLLPYAVERNPDKFGKIMASTGIPIISEQSMRDDPPDALLVSPWFFREVFLNREATYLDGGGVMIFPLPHFEIVGGDHD
jgi:SAM-dependent methyltransferase